MDNATLINRVISRLFPKRPKIGYTAEVDIKELLQDKVGGFLSATQKNKPSPSGPYSYERMCQLFPKVFPGQWNVSRSFVGWTNSMEPIMDYGDMLFRIPYEHWKKGNDQLIGNIVIYNYGNMRIVHRCIGKSGDKYVFKGDNNFRADPLVKEEQLQDVVIGIIHTSNKIKDGQD